MKHNRILVLTLALAMTAVSSAQQRIYICKDGAYTAREIVDQLEIDMTQSVDSITFSVPQGLAERLDTVYVTFSGATASVVIPTSLANDVTAQVDGAHVTITNTNATQEIASCLSGTTANGSLTYYGSYKTTVILRGADITNPSGAALDIEDGKRVDLELADGTVSTLTDGAGGLQKAALYCKGHLEISGAGTLNVSGNAKHAIASKEYCQIKKSTGIINILAAASDGIHAGQYFQMNGGTINMPGTTVGDGIQAELRLDDFGNPEPDVENTGEIIIKGGTFNITMALSEDTKAIKADGKISITGGTFDIKANSNGSRGIQTDANMTISEADNATTMTIAANGGLCTQAADADDPHRSMGIKVGGNLTINAGTITVTNNGSKARGIRCGSYTLNGGTVSATVKKDA